jgi:ornithine carbamoyltransferase
MAYPLRALGRYGHNQLRSLATSLRSGWWFDQYSNATPYRYEELEPTPNVKHILTMGDLSKDEVVDIMKVAVEMKKSVKSHEALRQQASTSRWGQHYTGNDRFSDILKGCSLLTLFEMPSLRSRIALEVGMQQLGGQAIFYSVGESTLGQKESLEDVSKVLSRTCNGISARVLSRNATRALAANATIPVLNALDDYAYPTQMLADLLTIIEHKGTWDGITMAFSGDLENNVTYDLMRTASLMGFNLNLVGAGEIPKSVWSECESMRTRTDSAIKMFETTEEAIKDVDVVYCDTWMSYRISPSEMESRTKLFMPYQVTAERMKLAKPDCVFMNCLPAARGMEQTAEVIDGPQSIVFDQAENNLHALKALLVYIMAPARFKRCMP